MSLEGDRIMKQPKRKMLILLCLWAAVFVPIYPEMVQKWIGHSDSSHGILVPFICGYLVWQKRLSLRESDYRPSVWGAVILGLSLAVYLIAYAGGVNVVARTMIVTSLFGMLLFTLGKKAGRILWFPVFFLLFMVPVPDTLLLMVSFPLQMFATKVSHFLIQAFSIPSYREGNMLYFAQTQLEVAEACSGIRSIVSYVMLSFLFAYMMGGDRHWKRCVIVLSAIPLALFSNILRVTGTGILAHFYGASVARGFLHEFSGMIVFAFGFILLLGEFMLLTRISKNERSQPEDHKPFNALPCDECVDRS